MTYASFESSVDASRPVEIYRFVLGTEEFLYTSAEDTITNAGDDFTAEAISRSELAIGKEERKRVVTVEVPALNPLAQRYIDTPPGERCTLSIFRFQRDDGGTPETILIYKGSILTVQFPDDSSTAKISLQSIEAATGREIPRYTYQLPCNHILYDALCKVDSGLFNHSGIVTVVSGNDITVAGAGASGFDFTGGYCRPTAGSPDFRLITGHTGDVLTLLLPFEVNPLSGNVQAFAGCDHLLDGDCSLVFNNEPEYGGFYFVPNRNIFSGGL